jgi:hypothetical protein
MGDLLSSIDGWESKGCGLRVLKCDVFYLIVLLSALCDEIFKDLRVSLSEIVRPVGRVDLMQSMGIPYLSKI